MTEIRDIWRLVAPKATPEVAQVIAQIASDVADETGLSVADLRGRSRVGYIVRARQMVFYLCRKKSIPVTAIGEAMRRDHSTVIHGARAIERRLGER